VQRCYKFLDTIDNATAIDGGLRLEGQGVVLTVIEIDDGILRVICRFDDNDAPYESYALDPTFRPSHPEVRVDEFAEAWWIHRTVISAWLEALMVCEDDGLSTACRSGMSRSHNFTLSEDAGILRFALRSRGPTGRFSF
jgi:hypothetical protein